MKRSISMILLMSILVALTQTAGAVLTADKASAADAPIVALRIEGVREAIYQNDKLPIAAAEGAVLTLRDVVDSYNKQENVQKITVAADNGVESITAVGVLQAHSIGGSADDRWLVRVNGTSVDAALSSITIQRGADIVLYYGDPAHIQAPKLDMERMTADGIVRFYSDGLSGTGAQPIAGATVIWDGMTYRTDDNGEIIIDSTGAGVFHAVRIERYADNGLPTVLRLPVGYTVKYGFQDVSQTSWYIKDVLFVSDQKLLNGISDSEFAPEAPMNRAMFVTVLGRLSGVRVDQSAPTGFADVQNDGWSAGYITWASENNIVGGYGDGTFGQYDPITREQIAVVLYRYAVSQEIDVTTGGSGGELTSFADAGSVSSYAVAAMQWAVGHKLITGSDGLLDPGSRATRAQVSAMLRRFITEFSLA